MRTVQLITSFCLCFLLWSHAPGFAFQPWSENVFEYVDREYGSGAADRLRFLYELVTENQHLPEMEKVTLVNTTVNLIPWIADSENWGESDYWASPMKTITTFGGDCEDIAIVKWFVLFHLNIPSDHLRLAYVKIKTTGEDHMVLLYIVDPTSPFDDMDIYVLDNYIPEVREGSERKDLIAILVLDENGNIVLLDDDGEERSIRGIYEEREIRQLDDLKERIEEEAKKYQALNEGRPLFPPVH